MTQQPQHTDNVIGDDASLVTLYRGRSKRFPLRLLKEGRILLLEKYYGVLPANEIALKMGVTRRMYFYEVKAWKEKNYDDWLDKDWNRLHRSPNVPDVEKYRALTNLKIKRMLAIEVNRTVLGSSVVVEFVKSYASAPAPVQSVASSVVVASKPLEVVAP